MRMGSSAAFLRASIPPSEKDGEVTTNGAAAALAAAPQNSVAPTASALIQNRVTMLSPLAVFRKIPSANRAGNTQAAPGMAGMVQSVVVASTRAGHGFGAFTISG